MSRNLTPKIILILVLVAVAVAVLYPPSKTLKPGIDLAGGTSLIYAINTEGLGSDAERDLAQRMITILRRRIDPANIQNLVWRPLGNTRFEIQMPLASKETQQKRDAYLGALDRLLDKNVNPAVILRVLQLPAEQRTPEIARFAQGDPNRMETLTNLASLHDERKQLQVRRDTLNKDLETLGQTLTAAQVNTERVQANRTQWIKLSDETLRKELTDFLGSETQIEPLTSYVKAYRELTEAFGKLTDQGGLNERYEQARRQLDRLNVSEEQVTSMLEMRGAARNDAIGALQAKFPDRRDAIQQVIAAYEEYSPYRGRLDDPADLKRMLQGAGILGFRILPTTDRGEPSIAERERYLENLKEKGPKAASDNRYVWIEIENMDEWKTPGSITGQFGDKSYVLASNLPDETMLHGLAGREWKLENSYPTNDQMGRRAIGFTLNIKGGDLFYNITSKNPNRPLAILLDDVAISAPNITAEGGIRQRGIIQGTFTPTEISDMVNKLNAGSLPARLIPQPISEKVIGPSVGADNLAKGIRSGLIGLALVVAFMIVYYAIGGSIADVALLLNILFTLAIMAAIRATFTLPGIAGLILTIGMSVDANVLIFERIREEQEKGFGLATAIRNGYQRAFSAIFDSNLTTILTAAILYYVASEDVKGFALVLMLGIGSSLFTAIFVTHVILDILVSKRVIKDRLAMLRLIRVPTINWMGMRHIFYTISGILVFGGLILFFARGSSKYDIEFTGGTSVQITLKDGVSLTRQNVEDQLVAVAQNNADLKAATVYSVGEPLGETPSGEKVYNQYEITTTAINTLETVVTFSGASPSVADATAQIRKAEADLSRQVGKFEMTPRGDHACAITTSRTSPAVVQDVLTKAFPNATVAESVVQAVVTDAIHQAFKGQLEIQQNLQPAITATDRITEEIVDTYPELADYIGGIRIETTLKTAATLAEIDQRLKDLRFRPDTQEIVWYPYAVFGPGLKTIEPNEAVSSFTFVSIEPEAGLRQLSDDEWQQFVENEKSRILLATQREASLPRVTQIDPFVGSEAKTRAIISIVLSLAAIVGYIWVRFGNLRFGLAAIIALFHDVSTALGAIAVSAFLATTVIGPILLISDFRINSTMIAAVLTLLGYSLNDTIVVFDRIRENRRKVQLTAQSITNSINQTMSRTLITGVTTIMVVLVMYIFGGPGLRGFNFVIFLGLVVGTYSSITIAAPLLLVNLPTAQQDKTARATKIENIATGSKVKAK